MSAVREYCLSSTTAIDYFLIQHKTKTEKATQPHLNKIVPTIAKRLSISIKIATHFLHF